MCFGGGGGRMSEPKREFQNRPVTVTGSQEGVDNPKDTTKATETLKIKRQKEEGTYVDPNLTTADKLTRKSGMSQADRKARKNRQQKAKHNYNKKKFSKSITGRKTGVA
jgi:hypothetical protein|tara:strand:+ start:28 stop:354 length:327 start_codon:yes stop_codon:yes gene_type:complete